MKRLTILVFFSLILTGFAAAQSDLQPGAIVNLTKSEPITVKQYRTELDRVIREQLAQNLGRQPTAAEFSAASQSLNTEQKRQVLDMMINERLVIQAAERDKIAVSDNELNQQIQPLRARMVQAIGRQPTDTEFATAIKNETGLELPAFREQMRRQFLLQKYLEFKKSNVLQTAKPPTEAEILEFYNNAKSQFVRPETVRFSMIQIPFGADKSKAKTLGDQLVKEIGGSPAKFDEVSLRGQVPNAGFQTDSGYLPRNPQAQQLVGTDLMNTAFSLKQGEVSRLAESTQGYHILKVTETYEMKILNLDDMVQPGTRVTVRDYIFQGLSQQRQQEVLAQASQELVTELRAGGKTFQVFDKNLGW
ncbi:MAG: SurA N-terminal domain-containing protein [Treponema sp.]|nr:SurA N-terminal domain-containing protein [Treponema sp.]